MRVYIAYKEQDINDYEVKLIAVNSTRELALEKINEDIKAFKAEHGLSEEEYREIESNWEYNTGIDYCIWGLEEKEVDK